MGPAGRFVARALTWPILPALVIGLVPVDGTGIAGSDVGFLVAMTSCWLVGILLTGRAFEQPAGWAFLGLGTALAWSSFAEEYALAALGDRELPGGDALATLADSSWLWWFVFIALALQLTPPARTGRLRRALPVLTVVAGLVGQVASLLRREPMTEPFEEVTSPWVQDGWVGDVASLLAFLAIIVLGLCVLASIALLVTGWRKARGAERRQLLWLVAGVVPLAAAVPASYLVSYLGSDHLAGYVMSAAIVTMTLGAALSVLRYRLYDVERVVSESVAYALAAASVVIAFGIVVVVVSRTTPLGTTSQLPTIAATLSGVAVARQSYLWARRAVDRGLDRRRYDAVQAMRTGLQQDAPDVDALLVLALSDPSARVVYPAEDGSWVTADGQDVVPGEHQVAVRRARVEYDPDSVERGVVEAVAQEAAAEIDNVALRAELARQVEVVTESRTRLASAQLDERRRIERDLHDGAQQRILAIALQLQSARLNGGEDLLRDEVDRAVAHLGVTVQELRDLAAGLQPAALSSGGLLAAVEDLAGRIPLDLTYDVTERRFPPALEGAAWFVVAEAVTNAVKHAGAGVVDIAVRQEEGELVVQVSDGGAGGADPQGSGLVGLADRVAAMGGSLVVGEREPSGTTVRAVFPCAS